MHKYQLLSMHIKLTKFCSPFLSIHQQRGEDKSNNKDVYALCIHEEERRKGSSPCIHALHREGMTRP